VGFAHEIATVLGPRAARPPSSTPVRCQRAGRPRSQGRQPEENAVHF